MAESLTRSFFPRGGVLRERELLRVRAPLPAHVLQLRQRRRLSRLLRAGLRLPKGTAHRRERALRLARRLLRV